MLGLPHPGLYTSQRSQHLMSNTGLTQIQMLRIPFLFPGPEEITFLLPVATDTFHTSH
jgi:hypothetical protein